jgi:hypothetical protein
VSQLSPIHPEEGSENISRNVGKGVAVETVCMCHVVGCGLGPMSPADSSAGLVSVGIRILRLRITGRA